VITFTELQFPKMQYIQKNRKYLKRTEKEDTNGVKIPGSGKRTKGIKKGVLLAGISPDGKLIVGFSLCHKNDLFDYIGGEWVPQVDEAGLIFREKYVNGYKEDGFGKLLALKRAEKWADYHNICVMGKRKEPADSEIKDGTVFIPSSIEAKLTEFVNQCVKYYKGKTFPAWICQLELDPTIPATVFNK